MVSEQIQKSSMDVTVRRRFLSKPLSENDNRDINSGNNRGNDFCICYHCGYLFFSYPYGIVLSIAKMEKAVGILREQRYRPTKEMCDGGNYFDGNVNFNGSGKSAVYSIQIECGKLVDFD